MQACQQRRKCLHCSPVPSSREALRVEDSTAYRWARVGIVDSVRVGGTVRIPSSELARVAGSALTDEPKEPT